jgi:hypothetical protein
MKRELKLYRRVRGAKTVPPGMPVQACAAEPAPQGGSFIFTDPAGFALFACQEKGIGIMEKLKLCIIPALASLCAAWAVPASAAIEVLRPVASQDLAQFIGSTVFGTDRAPLGTVTAVNETTGVIGVIGRHGQYALLDQSMLGRNGMILRAPTVSLGEFNFASAMGTAQPVIAPRIEIIEPPPG